MNLVQLRRTKATAIEGGIMTECVFCGSEEAYPSQYGTFCIPCATIVGEIVETHFGPNRRGIESLKYILGYSKDAEDDEVESIRIQLLEIEDMDEDDLTVEDMDNYNNLETRLWELTGGFEAEDFEVELVSVDSQPLIYTRRVVTEIVLEGEPAV